MTWHLISPSKLLSAPLDAVEDLQYVCTYVASPKSMDEPVFVPIMTNAIANSSFMAVRKKSFLENIGVCAGYIEKYQEQLAEIQDNAGEKKITPEAGKSYVALLKTIWHLKSTGIIGLVEGVEQQVVTVITDYSKSVLAFAESNNVPEKFCDQLKDILEEACKAFQGSHTLLSARDNVENQMICARMEGQRSGMLSCCVSFLKQKTSTNCEAIEKFIPGLKGVKFTDDGYTKIQNVAHVMMEDICKRYPEASQFGETVPDTLDTMCSNFLPDNAERMY